MKPARRKRTYVVSGWTREVAEDKLSATAVKKNTYEGGSLLMAAVALLRLKKNSIYTQLTVRG